jgi:3',5'-cyclic AMP phosphodiesterase CpdA
MTVTIPMSIDEYKVVHLSDLHFTGRPNEELNGIWQFFSTEEISSANLKILFDDIVTINPDHIFITGDITNTAHP